MGFNNTYSKCWFKYQNVSTGYCLVRLTFYLFKTAFRNKCCIRNFCSIFQITNLFLFIESFSYFFQVLQFDSIKYVHKCFIFKCVIGHSKGIEVLFPSSWYQRKRTKKKKRFIKSTSFRKFELYFPFKFVVFHLPQSKRLRISNMQWIIKTKRSNKHLIKSYFTYFWLPKWQ